MAQPTIKPVLTVTGDDGQTFITVTAAAGETVSVYAWVVRQEPDGKLRRVRTMQAAPLLNRTVSGIDADIPLGVPVVYMAYVTDAAGLQSPWETVPFSGVPPTVTRLASATDPSWRTPAQVKTMSAITREVAYGAHYVLGRADPITVADVRQLGSYTLTLVTATADQAAELRTLLDGSPHLLLQSSPDEGGNHWFLCTSYTEDRAVPTFAPYADRVWTLEAIATEPPAAPLAPSGAPYSAVAALGHFGYVAAYFPTYGEMTAWNGAA
ncbi:hypothetical protein [Actinomadura rayongensis]|uniref:Uncharacterized protein n=1 Tax=Actinomadura rayongensis TaxID=1429076 RepID=A0A6I4WL96_9ACTN|nr:hypothetical protein [Actinomadura rayongensis]MXQ67694.1 hypothetical protein [Actinomadura rayongensis]